MGPEMVNQIAQKAQLGQADAASRRLQSDGLAGGQLRPGPRNAHARMIWKCHKPRPLAAGIASLSLAFQSQNLAKMGVTGVGHPHIPQALCRFGCLME
jgi:hypothetical protein